MQANNLRLIIITKSLLETINGVLNGGGMPLVASNDRKAFGNGRLLVTWNSSDELHSRKEFFQSQETKNVPTINHESRPIKPHFNINLLSQQGWLHWHEGHLEFFRSAQWHQGCMLHLLRFLNSSVRSYELQRNMLREGYNFSTFCCCDQIL